MPVVAVCSEHGPVNVEHAFYLRNVTHFTIAGQHVQCPEPSCTKSARVMEGIYDFDADGRGTPVAAPAWSRDALEAVQGPVQQINEVVQSDLPTSQVVERLDALTSELRARDEELSNLIAAVVNTEIKGATSRSRMRTASAWLSAVVAGAVGEEAVQQGMHSPAAQALLKFLADTIR